MLKLKTLIMTGLLVLLFSLGAHADNPRVKLETSHGDIVLELFADEAPKTVDNFLGYVESGFYDGTIFHRVMQDFMIQGGGYTTGYEKKTTGPPITNEADNGLANKRGTVAMARTGDPHSATSQFFVNTVDNAFLDFKSKDARGWGYCVFGRVVEGLDTVDSIASVPTSAKSPRFQNAPEGLVVIEKASIVEDTEPPSDPASNKKENEQ